MPASVVDTSTPAGKALFQMMGVFAEFERSMIVEREGSSSGNTQERDAADHEVLQQVVAYYHATLTASPEALGYLERRGLRAAELIDHFQLGFANHVRRSLVFRLARFLTSRSH